MPSPPSPGIDGLGIDFSGTSAVSPLLVSSSAAEELAKVRSALHAHLDRKNGANEKSLASPIAKAAVSESTPVSTRHAERTPPCAMGKENTSPTHNDAPTIADTKAKFWRASIGSSARLPSAPATQEQTPVDERRRQPEESGLLSCTSLLDSSLVDTPSAPVTPHRAIHERRWPRSGASPLSSFLESSADRTLDQIANTNNSLLSESPKSRRMSCEEDMPHRPAIPVAMARTFALSVASGIIHEGACSEAASSEFACRGERELSCSSSSGSLRHLDYEESTMASSGDAQLSHRLSDRPDRPLTSVRCRAWLDEAPGQFRFASLDKGAVVAQTSSNASNEGVLDEEVWGDEVPCRTDRRWKPAAMAVSLALKEVRRQQREAGCVA